MYKLLIVDDSIIIQQRIRNIFQDADVNIVGMANNGVEAIEMFEHYKPDIITMDLTMPKMGGLECIQQLIAMDKDVSILVVSALSDKSTGLKALQYGARGFISKPFDQYKLLYALQKLISAKNKHRLAQITGG